MTADIYDLTPFAHLIVERDALKAANAELVGALKFLADGCDYLSRDYEVPLPNNALHLAREALKQHEAKQ